MYAESKLLRRSQDESPLAEQTRLSWQEGCYVRVVGQASIYHGCLFHHADQTLTRYFLIRPVSPLG